MGVRSAGVLRLGRRRFEPWQLLVMAIAPGPAAEGGQASSAAEGGQASSAAEGGQASSAAEGGQASMDSDPAAAMEWVHSAVADGADIVEVPGDEVCTRRVVPFIATVRDAYPELVIGVRTSRVRWRGRLVRRGPICCTAALARRCSTWRLSSVWAWSAR